jgi:hypothetical protein
MPALSILLDLWCAHKDEAEAARHFIPQTKQIKTVSCEAAHPKNLINSSESFAKLFLISNLAGNFQLYQ